MADLGTLSPQQLFDEAAAFQSAAKFEPAIERYQALLKKGITSRDVEANLAKAYAQSKDYGRSIQHWDQAIALSRFDSDARHGLETTQALVENNLGTKMSHPAEFGHQLGSYVRMPDCLSLVVLVVIALIAHQLYGKPEQRKWARISAGILAAFLLGAAGWISYGSSIATVVGAGEIRSAPLESADVTDKIPSGTRLRIIRVSGSFAQVERPSGFNGWINKDLLVQSPY